MTNYTITENWFNDIKDRVPHANDYHYEEYGQHNVEVDVHEEMFIEVSKELGWI